MTPVRVKFPGSYLVHDFLLHPDGKVTRTTVGVGKEVSVRTPVLRTREDLERYLVRDQGYRLVTD